MGLSIGVIGRTAYGTDLCDGQTIKTRVLIDELKRKYPSADFYIVDTYQYQKNVLTILKNLMTCMKKSRVVFILLSRNGMRVLFPIVNFINRFYRRPVLHDCIGAALEEHVKKYKGLKKQLNRFEVNWVESKQLKKRLEKLGVENVEYLPNFKRLEAVQESELPQHFEAPYQFCTFSRVNEAKGIGRAAEAVIKINKEAGKRLVCLDIYGPIEGNYELVMNRYIEASDGAIEYKGVAEYAQSVAILKDYYALLFPTMFEGEGFPGTLLDAFHAGIPVIATDWHLNGEIISHAKTGYLYDHTDGAGLERWIMHAIENSGEIQAMKRQCLEEAKRYSPDSVMEVINRKIETVISEIR